MPTIKNDLLLRAARALPVERTPVWIMRQAGRYLPEYRAIREKVPFLDLCKNPDLAAEVTVQPVSRLGVDAAIVFSDILIPVEAMGLELELGDSGPRFPTPVRSAEDIERLRVPDPVERTGFVAEAIRKARRALADSVPVIGFAGAPFTLASYVVEGGGSKNFLAIKRLLFEEPRLAHRLFDKLTRAVTAYLAMQVEAGASIVQVFDSWGGELSPRDFVEFSQPYLQRIVSEVSSMGVPVIVFGTSMSSLLELIQATGATVIGLDWRIDIAQARKRLGQTPVQGNLDPAALFLGTGELKNRVEEVLVGAGPIGHIFNLGHGIFPQAEPDKARSLVAHVHEISQRLNAGAVRAASKT